MSAFIVLNILTDHVVQVLKHSLRKISTTWWKSLFIEKLTFQQQSIVRQYSFDALEWLYLAALLHVVDQNWYSLFKHPDVRLNGYSLFPGSFVAEC